MALGTGTGLLYVDDQWYEWNRYRHQAFLAIISLIGAHATAGNPPASGRNHSDACSE